MLPSRFSARRSIFQLALASLAAVFLVTPMAAKAADDIYLYLSIAGSDIDGDVQLEGREDSIRVFSASATGFSTIDPASGRPTGRRQHRPFVLTKAIDKASPLIAQAWNQGQSVDHAEFRFYRRDETGVEVHYYTIRLEGGTVMSLSTRSPNTQNPANAAVPPTETIRIAFSRIQWTDEINGTSTTSDW